MNKVFITGRLGADPDLRYTQTGTAVARFNLAVERNMGKDKEKETDWLTVVAWGKRAEFASNYLSKGRKVLVQGNLKTGSYTNKDGFDVKTVEIQAEDIEFCDARPEGRSQGQGQGSYSQGGGNNETAGGGGDFVEVNDEDLPF